MKKTPALACPCGSNRLYADCCEPLHLGSAATSAEALMRSRYSAYVLKLAAYVLATWHPDTRPAELSFEDEQTKWLGLAIERHAQQDDSATVEFVARYKITGRAHRLHEVSRFTFESGRWYYLDGKITEN